MIVGGAVLLSGPLTTRQRDVCSEHARLGESPYPLHRWRSHGRTLSVRPSFRANEPRFSGRAGPLVGRGVSGDASTGAPTGVSSGRRRTVITTPPATHGSSPEHGRIFDTTLRDGARVVRACEAVALARTRIDDVEFSPEDATRSDPAFLLDVLAAVIEAGATTINIADTVGYATPAEYEALIERVCALAARSPGIVVSTHCHDDLGLAVANSLAGVRAGARQVECTINGIGERAGNASLEEIVMALHTRSDYFGIGTRIDTRELMRTSRIVSSCTGAYVAPNKAIVGANSFAH